MMRGIYFWAGNATIDLQRIKFPDMAVDAEAHLAAYREPAARELARSGVNTAFLSMNWGFPPEIEEPHWQEFSEAVRVYRKHGIAVFGYVQSSNCVRIGSYRDKDWYAIDPDGHLVPYFPDRMMTCWNHPEWLSTVRSRALLSIQAGADGVFFDNVWMGATAWIFDGRSAGFAGCACPRCRTAFRADHKLEIPRRLGEDAASRTYLQWRARLVQRRLAEWRAAILQERGDARVMLNNCDVILRDTGSMFGLDPVLLAPLQDALLVENVALPHVTGNRLVANALPLKALRALVPDKPIATVAYHHGIGLDGPPPPALVRRHIAEAVAVGAAPILKGSEYLDDQRRFSVFTAPAFADARASAAHMLRWLDEHEQLFHDRIAAPEVLVPLPDDCCDGAWTRHVTPALRTAHALIRAQVPFAFSTGGEEGTQIALPKMKAWRSTPAICETVTSPLVQRFSRAYFGRARVRRIIDRSGLTRRFLRSGHFAITRQPLDVVSRLARNGPRASSPGTVLIERWSRPGDVVHLHCVNYEDAPTTVQVAGGAIIALHTPDAATGWLDRDAGKLRLENYAIIELKL